MYFVESPGSDSFEDHDAFRAAWDIRVDEVFASGLDYLRSLDELPCPDGQLLDFVERLVGLGRDLPRHADGLVALLNKENPHLQEAGVRIARALVDWRSGWFPDSRLPAKLEAALLTRMSDPDVDDWVAEALLDFFEAARAAATRLQMKGWRGALANLADEQNRRRTSSSESGAAAPGDIPKIGILRNRAIFPRARAANYLQSLIGGD